MRLPEGRTSLSVDGVEYTPDADGCVTVPATAKATAARLGLVLVGLVETTDDAGDESAGSRRRRKRGGA